MAQVKILGQTPCDIGQIQFGHRLFDCITDDNAPSVETVYETLNTQPLEIAVERELLRSKSNWLIVSELTGVPIEQIFRMQRLQSFYTGYLYTTQTFAFADTPNNQFGRPDNLENEFGRIKFCDDHSVVFAFTRNPRGHDFKSHGSIFGNKFLFDQETLPLEKGLKSDLIGNFLTLFRYSIHDYLHGFGWTNYPYANFHNVFRYADNLNLSPSDLQELPFARFLREELDQPEIEAMARRLSYIVSAAKGVCLETHVVNNAIQLMDVVDKTLSERGSIHMDRQEFWKNWTSICLWAAHYAICLKDHDDIVLQLKERVHDSSRLNGFDFGSQPYDYICDNVQEALINFYGAEMPQEKMRNDLVTRTLCIHLFRRGVDSFLQQEEILSQHWSGDRPVRPICPLPMTHGVPGEIWKPHRPAISYPGG